MKEKKLFKETFKTMSQENNLKQLLQASAAFQLVINVFGNACIILAYEFKRRSSNSILVMLLALSDTCFSIALPLELINRETLSNDAATILCQIKHFMLNTFVHFSLCLYTFIAIERYIFIKRKYNAKSALRLLNVLVSALILSITCGAIVSSISYSERVTDREIPSWQSDLNIFCAFKENYLENVFVTYRLALFLILFSTMVSLYAIIFVHIRREKKRRRTYNKRIDQRQGSSGGELKKKERSSYTEIIEDLNETSRSVLKKKKSLSVHTKQSQDELKICVLIFLFFLLFCAANSFRNGYLKKFKLDTKNNNYTFYAISNALFYLAASVKPMIYLIFSSSFRKRLSLRFQTMCKTKKDTQFDELTTRSAATSLL